MTCEQTIWLHLLEAVPGENILLPLVPSYGLWLLQFAPKYNHSFMIRNRRANFVFPKTSFQKEFFFSASTYIFCLSGFPAFFHYHFILRSSPFRATLEVGGGRTSYGPREIQLEYSSAWDSWGACSLFGGGWSLKHDEFLICCYLQFCGD